MAKTSGLTVKGRIFGGFGAVLAFLVAVATVALLGFSAVRDNVEDYSRVSDNTAAIQQIDRNVADLRRNVFLYMGDGSPKVLERANELRTILRRDLTATADRVRLPETKAALEKMLALFERYSRDFDKVVELRQERERLVREGTDTLGRETTAALAKLTAARIQDRDFDTLVNVSGANEHFHGSRLAVLRYQGRTDEAEADSALKRLGESIAMLENAVRAEAHPADRAELEKALANVKSYRDAFVRQHEVTTTYRTLVAAMGEIAGEFGDQAQLSANRQHDALAQIQGSTFSLMASRSTIATVASAVALVLGLLAAYLIARSILVPINRMTHAMGDLAGGKLDVAVPALERTDEIGEMAQAVQVFKQNAVDKKRMEEEAEAARQAQAKAEAEQRAREAAIVAEVAEVAKAASAGDLDRRIDLAGKDGFLLNLCEGVNNLVNLTGIALKDVAAVLASVARGDLTRRITNEYGGLFGQLKGDVNQTADKLFEIVTNINSAAGQIGSAASEVAAGSQDLSERSEQQASALEETAASMEELAATVRQNAANAQQANQLAAGAREIAAGGGEVVNNAIGAMGRIEQSSQKIEDIVGMIDEIAFQTNLLALNAAVEAARAGDAGKGFAVVAQEVRNLAQRSAQASKEIKTLIAESSTQVRSGAELVKGAGKTLEDILGSVKRVADIVAEIAAASSEQASGIDQVNAAVSQMDEMTQQNAALVEESAAAAHALEDQSRELNRLMGFFNTGAAAVAATPTPAAAAPSHKPAAKPAAKSAAKTTVKPKLASTAKASASEWEEF